MKVGEPPPAGVPMSTGSFPWRGTEPEARRGKRLPLASAHTGKTFFSKI